MLDKLLSSLKALLVIHCSSPALNVSSKVDSLLDFMGYLTRERESNSKPYISASNHSLVAAKVNTHMSPVTLSLSPWNVEELTLLRIYDKFFSAGTLVLPS